MTNTINTAGYVSHFIADCGRPLEAMNLANRAALIGGGLYGLRVDWIEAAQEEASRAAYREDTEFDGLFSGPDANMSAAFYEAIIA